MASQAVKQYEAGDAGAIQDVGDIMAFVLEIVPREAATRNDQHGRAIGLVRRKNDHARPCDSLRAPAAVGRVGRGLLDNLSHARMQGARRRAWPKLDGFARWLRTWLGPQLGHRPKARRRRARQQQGRSYEIAS